VRGPAVLQIGSTPGGSVGPRVLGEVSESQETVLDPLRAGPGARGSGPARARQRRAARSASPTACARLGGPPAAGCRVRQRPRRKRAEVSRDRARKDGRAPWCKACVRRWQRENAGHLADYHRRWLAGEARQASPAPPVSRARAPGPRAPTPDRVVLVQPGLGSRRLDHEARASGEALIPPSRVTPTPASAQGAAFEARGGAAVSDAGTLLLGESRSSRATCRRGAPF
jgi:hypothetical protein